MNLWLNTLWAVTLREARTIWLNRFLQVFSVAMLASGLTPLIMQDAGAWYAAASPILMQAILYLVSLFSLLIGMASVQADEAEYPFILSQPTPLSALLGGKFLAAWVISSSVCLLLVLPSVMRHGLSFMHLALWFSAAMVCGAFAALGMAIEVMIRDHVRALLIGILLWFALLFGFDLLMLALTRLDWVRAHPGVWALHLMLNPLDALRIAVLLSVEEIPLSDAGAPMILRWWLSHLWLWFFLLTSFWIVAALLPAIARLRYSDS